MPKLPNTLIIGVQKSATSWLAARLNDHPDAFVHRGEVHYFDWDRNYVKGPDWYASHLAAAGGARIRCDKTPDYFWTTCEGVLGEPLDKPGRIKALLPDAKCVLLLRDPLKRAYSAWNHIVRGGHVSARRKVDNLLNPEIADIVKHHGILTRGLYHNQLERFRSVFPDQQILILFQETDVVANPQEGLRKLCIFLGLNPEHTFTKVQEVENRFDGTVIGNSMALGTPRAMRSAILRLDRYVLTRLPLERIRYPEPSAKARNALAEYFEDDCRRLADLIGPLPSSWLDGRLGSIRAGPLK